MAQRLLRHIPTTNSTSTSTTRPAGWPASVSLVVAHRSSSSEDTLLRPLFSPAQTATATSGFRFRHLGSSPHYCNNLGGGTRNPDYLSSSSLSTCAYLPDNFPHPRLLIKVGLLHSHHHHHQIQVGSIKGLHLKRTYFWPKKRL